MKIIKWVLLIILGICILVFILFFAFNCWFKSNVPSGKDVQRCNSYIDHILKEYKMPQKSIAVSGKDPIFHYPGCKGIFGGHNDKIYVYYVLNTNDQNKIINILKKYKDTEKKIPIQIIFYEKEVWMKSEDPIARTGWGTREYEAVIREEIIE